MYGAKYKKLHSHKLQLHIWRVIEGEGEWNLSFCTRCKDGNLIFLYKVTALELPTSLSSIHPLIDKVREASNPIHVQTTSITQQVKKPIIQAESLPVAPSGKSADSEPASQPGRQTVSQSVTLEKLKYCNVLYHDCWLEVRHYKYFWSSSPRKGK